MLRDPSSDRDLSFWDWGIPTADAVIGARELCEESGATLIASGGITGPRDTAIAIALGAHAVGSARVLLKILVEQGADRLASELEGWRQRLRGMMFLTGSRTVAELRSATLRSLP
jgi:isopentenyl-diphosphate delta-isomerase